MLFLVIFKYSVADRPEIGNPSILLIHQPFILLIVDKLKKKLFATNFQLVHQGICMEVESNNIGFFRIENISQFSQISRSLFKIVKYLLKCLKIYNTTLKYTDNKRVSLQRTVMTFTYLKRNTRTLQFTRRYFFCFLKFVRECQV